MGLSLMAEHGTSHSSIIVLQTARPLRAAKTPKQDSKTDADMAFTPYTRSTLDSLHPVLVVLPLSLFAFLR